MGTININITIQNGNINSTYLDIVYDDNTFSYKNWVYDTNSANLDPFSHINGDESYSGFMEHTGDKYITLIKYEE